MGRIGGRRRSRAAIVQAFARDLLAP